jgi:glutamate formiminotransferase
MKEKIKEENWAPDFGNAEIHPTAGATACGARIPLLAYNINLDTADLDVASKISRAIRFSSGGFRFVQAGPMELTERSIVQVSMNILDFNKNSIYRIYETVKMEALRFGVEVVGSEVIGSFPLKAVTDSLKYYFARDNRDVKVDDLTIEEVTAEAIKYMGFEDFTSSKILEANL